RQARPVHVGQPARDLHDLRRLRIQPLLLDLVDGVVVDLLAGGAKRKRARGEHQRADDEFMSAFHSGSSAAENKKLITETQTPRHGFYVRTRAGNWARAVFLRMVRHLRAIACAPAGGSAYAPRAENAYDPRICRRRTPRGAALLR